MRELRIHWRNNMSYDGDTNLINKELDLYKSISREEIRNVAQNSSTPTRDWNYTIYLNPKRRKNDKTPDIICLYWLLSNSQAQVDRSVQPQPGPLADNFGTPNEHQFKNGLTLMVVENHKLPQVSVSLVSITPLPWG